MQIIPLTSDYDQSLIVQLGDARYEIAAAWNERNKIFAFDLIRDADQEVLVTRVPMLIGQDMLAPYALGMGGLVMTDLSAKNTDAGPEDLGTRVIMTWLSNEELAAIAAALTGAGAPQTIVVPGAVGGGSSSGPVIGGGGATTGTTVVNQVVNNVVNNFTSEGGGGLNSVPELDDDSGDEVVIARFITNTATNPNPTLALAMSVLARGDGTVRVYTGGLYEGVGTVGTPTGSLRDSAAVSGAGENPYDLSASFANPSGFLSIKVTMQSSAPATSVGVVAIDGGIA